MLTAATRAKGLLKNVYKLYLREVMHKYYCLWDFPL